MVDRNKQILGKWGEDQALGYLELHGYHLVERNYRTREGEIDLIVTLEKGLVFVEVKTRATDDSGYPEESVTDEKLEHLTCAAESYIQTHKIIEEFWRFDVVSVIGTPNSNKVEFEWFQDVM
jgi:putative endonuclease